MNPILSRFVDVPALVAPEWQKSLEMCAQFLGDHVHAVDMLAASSDEKFWPAPDSWQAQYRPYDVKNGVLTIPVRGVMLNDFSYATTWATGYQYIAKAWERAQADEEVVGIVLSINSGGGDAAGNFDMVDKMAATKGKPCMAICENAYSAAYSIASVADKIAVSRTGGLGSIGVVTGHLDVSGAMEKAGMKFTFITAPKGGDKVDGNPYEPLSDSARERMQDRVDELYSHFVATVSRNRGMTEKAVIATKARTFTASQSLSNGLADMVAPADESLASFTADLSPKTGAVAMSEKKDETVALAVHESAVKTAREEGHKSGHAEGLTAGARAERERINAILSSDAGKARPTAAHLAALETEMSVEGAVAFISKLPEEQAAAPAAPAASAHANPLFTQAMNEGKNPNVQPGAEKSENQVASKDDASAALDIAHSMGIPGLRPRQK